MKSPEPKGTAPMFGRSSWERPDHGAPAPASPERAPLPECPDKVSTCSFREFLTARRAAEWEAHAVGAGIDFSSLIRQAGELANSGPDRNGLDRHRTARGHLRVMLSDAIRAAREKSANFTAPLPVLY